MFQEKFELITHDTLNNPYSVIINQQINSASTQDKKESYATLDIPQDSIIKQQKLRSEDYKNLETLSLCQQTDVKKE